MPYATTYLANKLYKLISGSPVSLKDGIKHITPLLIEEEEALQNFILLLHEEEESLVTKIYKIIVTRKAEVNKVMQLAIDFMQQNDFSLEVIEKTEPAINLCVEHLKNLDEKEQRLRKS